MKKIQSVKLQPQVIFFLIIALIFLQTACSPSIKLSKEVKKSDSNNTYKPNFKKKKAKEFDLNSPMDVAEKETYDFLLKKDFGAIERLANKARENKERLVGGYWKIDSIYEGLTGMYSEYPEQEITDQMWKDRIELLSNWKKESPNSITAGVALALSYIEYGWFARGFGYIDAVSDEDLRLLNERLSMAERELIEAKSLNIRCPRLYREELFLGMAKGMSQTEFNEIYEEATKFEPNYLQFYLVKSEYIMPRWSGKQGDWENYIDSLPDELAKLETDETDIIFFVVVAGKLADSSVNLSAIKSRDRIYKGFDDLEKKYKSDKKRLNQCAYLSFVTSNIPGAKWAFTRIGNDWDKDVWRNKEKFNLTKQAAMQDGANF
jgi:hypothetical protein